MPTDNNTLQIGSTVWKFDINYRRYRTDDNGRPVGGPIYREHWRPVTIIGETPRSWLCGPTWVQTKIPKKGPHLGFALSRQEVEDDLFMHDHRYRITQKLERCSDVAVLKQVAELIGYKAEEGK